MINPSPPRRLLVAIVVSLPLAGCMVGPNYAGPPRVAPIAEGSRTFVRAGTSSASTAPLLARWWEALRDPMLDELETLALANSPTIEQSKARIEEARAQVRQSGAALLPTGGANATYIKLRTPDIDIGSTGSGSEATPVNFDRDVDLYTVGANASWEIDLFGGTRRRVANARNRLQASEANLQDAQVSLTKNVATSYVNLRSAQKRLQLAQEGTRLAVRELAITRDRRRLGTASDVDVEKAVMMLKQAEGSALPISGQIEVYSDELAALLGREPGTLDAMLGRGGELPSPPAITRIGDPASLLRRRPDIRAAERQLAAANEMIGASIAQYFPHLSLIGFGGFGSTSTTDLLSGRNFTAVAAPSLSWNILNFPQIGAQVKQARASFAEQAATYRSTVLDALRDANNALSRFGHQRDNVSTLIDREASAKRSAALARARSAGGTASELTVLNAESDRVRASNSRLEAEAQLTSDWITLQSALGLGWQELAPVS